MTQDEQSAKYDAMPHSAIATGLVDCVLPVEQMPRRLVDYVRRGEASQRESDVDTHEHLSSIFALLRDQTGNDFTHYKQKTILRRIQRRMRLLQIGSIADYVAELREVESELDALFRDLLIGVTHFFRDPAVFEALGESVLQRLLADRPAGQSLRVWVPGCATGEEAYSIAILVTERLMELDRQLPVQIFATDIDGRSVDFGRAGVYPGSIETEVSPERLGRFFRREGTSYAVGKRVRESLIFSVHSLIKDPPFSGLDLICCRNVFIYLGAELQKRLLPLFHYALRPGGFLVLGPSESIAGFDDLFDTIDGKAKIFRRKEPATRRHVKFPLFPVERAVEAVEERFPDGGPATEKVIARLADKALLEHYTPPTVIVNSRHEVLHLHGRTGDLLELPAGTPDMNLVRMARRGLRTPLRVALHKASKQNATIVSKDITVRANGGQQRRIDLIVKPFPEAELGPGLFMVVFRDQGGGDLALGLESDAARSTAASDDPMVLESELRSTRDYLQTTIEELETANAKLRYSNEEMLSTNEEMQSTNEEMETSKEELQSVNEELETVNAELNEKVDQLDRVNNDIRNLLTSTQIATVFLDNDLRIKSFTPAATGIFKLIAGDIGRHITDLAPRIEYEGFTADAESVLQTLARKEHEVVAEDNRTYIARILPYRTLDDVVDGLVVTFVDITMVKRAHAALRASEERFRELAEMAPGAFWVQGIEDYGDLYISPGYERIWGRTRESVYEDPMSWIEAIHPDDRERVDGAFARVLASDGELEFDEEYRIIRADGTIRWIYDRRAAVLDDYGNPCRYVGIAEDVTERTQARDIVKSSEKMLAEAQRLAHIGSWEWDMVKDEAVWSDEMYRIYGFEPRAFQPSYEKTLQLVHPDDRRHVQDKIETTISQDAPYEVEFRVLLPDGSTRYLSAAGRLERDVQGDFTRLVGTAQDITMRKHVEAALEQALKLESLGVLAGGLAHDFNNLLVGILGNARLALRRLEPESSIYNLVSGVVGAGERAAELTNQMLTYSGGGRFEFRAIDLNALIDRVSPLMASLLSGKGVLQRHLEQNLPPVHADASQVQQVIMNLTSNAAEALQDPTGILSLSTGTVTVRGGYPVSTYVPQGLPGGRYVWLEVTDSGVGMSEETRTKMCDPFFTTKFKGRGLGMAAVLGIVRAHGAALEVTSAPGEGTRVRVSFPASTEPLEESEQERLDMALESMKWRGSGTILVVDDEESVRSVLRHVLEESGLTVLTASNGREAVELFRPRPAEIDLVLLDLTMPIMDGPETFLALRSIRSDAKVVLLSGYTEEVASKRFQGIGIMGFIHKPFEEASLLEVVRELLGV